MSSEEIKEDASLSELKFFSSNMRLLTQTELEKCQCLPSGYTKILSWEKAQDVIGDGWTIDVICQFFKNLPKRE